MNLNVNFWEIVLLTVCSQTRRQTTVPAEPFVAHVKLLYDTSPFVTHAATVHTAGVVQALKFYAMDATRGWPIAEDMQCFYVFIFEFKKQINAFFDKKF